MPTFVGAIVDSPPARKRAAGMQSRLPRGWQVYDAAATTDLNKRHWANADSYSSLWANRADVRQKLRDRSRYEQGNNGYLRGACRTAANDIVGRRGPKYRFAFEDLELNAWLDWEFAKYLKAIGFRRKLKTMVRAKKGDGEAVAIFANNPALQTPVKLDIKLVEAEQLTTPISAFGVRGELRDRTGELSLLATDGILFDRYGNPVEYHILKEHPGSGGFGIDPYAFDRLPAASVIHWFDAERPGQARGVPDTTTSLPLCAMLRRFSLSSLLASEIQSNYAGVLETDGAANPDEPPVEIPGIENVPGLIPTLPDKYKFKGFEPTHPTATYPQFKREILSEIGRGMGLPYNVIAADSSSHNYSSARLDTQEYQDDVNDERNDIEEVVLERIKDTWLAEALAIPGYVPFDLPELPLGMGDWFWSGWNYIDPTKEVTAIQIRLENNLTTLKAEHAKNGDDWKEVLTQRAEEIALCKELGISPMLALPSPFDPTHPANRPEPPPEPNRAREEVAAWTR